MKEKYYYRNCKGLRNHKEIHQEKTRGGDDEGFFNGFIISHIILSDPVGKIFPPLLLLLQTIIS